MKTVLLAVLIGAMLAVPAAAQEPYAGETMITLLTSTETYLIDIDFNIVKTWHGTSAPATVAYLLPGESILRPCVDPDRVFGGSGSGGRLQIIDTNDNIVWDYFFSDDTVLQHHDIEPMPNGNVLVLAWERKSQAEAIAAGRQGISGEMWFTMIAEIEPVGATGGNIVWEWHLFDHLIQDADPTKDNFGVVADHPELLDINFGSIPNADWDHANSIDYNPGLDQILISVLKMSEVYVIDHSTTTEEAAGHTGGNRGHGGDILYRWGNPQVYQRGDENDQYYFVVHGGVWIEPGLPGAGNILTFNNGDRPGTGNDYSSVEEIVPPMDTGGNYIIDPGEPFGPAAPVWVYQDPPGFYSVNRSGAFRMPNGNTLICETSDKNIFEVTAGGDKVWQYSPPAAVHRAPRYWDNASGVADPPAPAPQALQNHPNPFNPLTTITFRIATPGAVKLEVFDITGRLVATPLHRVMEAGPHDVVWDGRDRHGRAASSGVYFYRLSAPGLVQSAKMVLAK